MRPPRLHTRLSTARIALAVLGVAVLCVGAAVGWFRAVGGRWFYVATPSMGEAAPVGSLVVTRPGTAQVGDIISFTTSFSPKVYTHRVVEITDSGLRTQGDINGAPDPWVVAPDHVIGVVTHAWQGAGFLYHGLPWLLIGWVVVWVVTSRVAQRWRSHARLVGASVVATLVTLWLQPWVGMEPVGYAPKGEGVDVVMVSTGLLPIRVQARGGTYTDLRPGQVGTVFTEALDVNGRFQVFPQIHMGWLGWVVLVVVCVAPLLYTLLVGFPPLRDEPDRTDDPRPSWTPWAGAAAVVVLAAAVLAPVALTPQSTQAAWTARIQNTNDKLGSGRWADCARNTTGAWGAWSMGTIGLTEPDIAGNGRTGTYEPVTSHTLEDSCQWDTTKAATFTGAQCMKINQTPQAGPQTFSLEAWFSAPLSAVGSGKLIGWGTSPGATDGANDRHIYLDGTGRVVFGLYDGSVHIVASSTSYADNAWHHVVGTLSGGVMTLYLDGVLIGSKSGVGAENSVGYWKVGCGSLANWRTAAGAVYTGPSYYTGSLSYVAIYTTALNASTVSAHYKARLR